MSLLPEAPRLCSHSLSAPWSALSCPPDNLSGGSKASLYPVLPGTVLREPVLDRQVTLAASKPPTL